MQPLGFFLTLSLNICMSRALCDVVARCITLVIPHENQTCNSQIKTHVLLPQRYQINMVVNLTAYYDIFPAITTSSFNSSHVLGRDKEIHISELDVWALECKISSQNSLPQNSRARIRSITRLKNSRVEITKLHFNIPTQVCIWNIYIIRFDLKVS